MTTPHASWTLNPAKTMHCMFSVSAFQLSMNSVYPDIHVHCPERKMTARRSLLLNNLDLWFVINFDFCFQLKFIFVIHRGKRSILTEWNVLIYSLPNVLMDFYLKLFTLLPLLKGKISLCPLMFYFLLCLSYLPTLFLKVISFCKVLYFLMSVKKYFWEITELLYFYTFGYSKLL